MKPVLFFDFDDMLVLTMGLLRDFLNEHFSIKIPKGIFLCGYSLWGEVNDLLPPERKVTKDQFYEACAVGFLASRDWHLRAMPMPGAQECIPRLAGKYSLWLATA